jgi:HK97 family phage major capsid protein
MQAAMALALDRAILTGAGGEAQPRGIVNQTGVGTVAAVGTPTTYAKVNAAILDILTANYLDDPSTLAWIQHPRDAAVYNGLTDTLGQPIRPTPWAASLQKYLTTSIPTTLGAGAESLAIVGDFSQVLVGMRTSGVQMEVFNAGQADSAAGETINALSQAARWIRVYLRADVALVQPTWFAQMTGITVT